MGCPILVRWHLHIEPGPKKVLVPGGYTWRGLSRCRDEDPIYCHSKGRDNTKSRLPFSITSAGSIKFYSQWIYGGNTYNSAVIKVPVDGLIPLGASTSAGTNFDDLTTQGERAQCPGFDLVFSEYLELSARGAKILITFSRYIRTGWQTYWNEVMYMLFR